MPQTMLGLLALALATLLSFSQQRVTIQSYEVRLRDEYSVAASGLVTQIMELVGARSFDEGSTPQWINQKQRLPTVADFTWPHNFGRIAGYPGNGGGLQTGIRKRDDNFPCNLMKPEETPLCTDVDDFDGIEWQAVHVPIGNDRNLNFEISIRVEYVDERDPSLIVNYPTNSKLVVIRARTPDLRLKNEIVRLERVIAYDPVKAEAEFESVYGPLLSGPNA